jgi:hypothetical protein
MKTQRRSARIGREGFTLIEALSALAIASVIVIASTALVHNVALFFDRGTRGVTDAERLMLAVERLSADFSSARFISRRDGDSASAAFTATLNGNGGRANVIFVGAGRDQSGRRPDDDIINLTVEEDGEIRRLVRRRATWSGPSTRFEEVRFEDPVILIEGRLDISFLFGRVMPNGTLAWYANWTGESEPPRYVRLLLRDLATGTDLLGESDFVVRANAPAACGRAEATVACLSVAPSVQTGAPGAER